MKTIFCLLLLSSTFSFAQPAEEINARYKKMVDNSQTFKEYKVIKKTTLDAFWNSVADSLANRATVIETKEAHIGSLKASLANMQAEVKKREEAVAEIVYDSTHITVLGISFHKASFISVAGCVTAGLIFLAISLFTRSQLIAKTNREKSEALLLLSSEYEEYKHRAVEKQMKLSRELQNERNRLIDIQHNEVLASVLSVKKK